MTVTFKVVDRPKEHGNVKQPRPETLAMIAALIETVATGKAIEIPRAQTSLPAIGKRYLRHRGYRLRTRAVGKTATLAWCERIPPAAGATP